MTWDTFEREVEKLAALIDSPIEIIIPIVRGGLIPGRLLATKLAVKTMHALTVKKNGSERFVVTEIKEDL